jgi:hypothetical protein
MGRPDVRPAGHCFCHGAQQAHGRGWHGICISSSTASQTQTTEEAPAGAFGGGPHTTTAKDQCTGELLLSMPLGQEGEQTWRQAMPGACLLPQMYNLAGFPL